MVERTLTPQEFSNRWSKSQLKESAASQQHFLDLCRMLGQKQPVEVDPEGEFFTFERSVNVQGGGKGFADVWYKGRFALEYKGKHKDLAAAYDQLLRYREDLENPPLLVVCDMDRFEVHTNFTGTAKQVYAFTNEELPEPENLKVLRALFENPDSLRPTRTAESVTEQAAKKFATLADGLRSREVDPEQAAHFLNKLLFCLFAEDVEILPRGLFTRIAERTRKDPKRFAQYVGDLFESMSSGGDFMLEDIRHFNGGLFADAEVIPLEPKEIGALAEAAKLDWGSVEPAIFGTLFERSLDPSQRAQLGAHYTSREDILAIVEPVLMAPLRREWERVQEDVQSTAEKMHPTDRASRNRSLTKMRSSLTAFLDKLRSTRVLDPACGSGNFLYVSLKQLLDLEKEVSSFSERMGAGAFFPEVSPEQLYGIETSPYAHELAQVSIWIGYLQWMVENGFGARREPVLGPMDNILEMDAIIARTEDGELYEPQWPEADVIVGNPPFLGSRRMRLVLGDHYCDELIEVYEGKIEGLPDLICYWFEQARGHIGSGYANRAGLLATNSIRGGSNRRVLERIKNTGDIFMAWSDREWVLDGASVRVSMVGFDGGQSNTERNRTLDGVSVENINPDLTAEADLSQASILDENKGIGFQGVVLRGPFDLPREKAVEMLDSVGNPNGRPNADVLRPRVNGMDLTRRPRDSYVVDFGVEMPLEEAALYEAPFEFIQEHVYPMRQNTKQKTAREKWWLHWNPRPKMRQALSNLNRFVATPTVAKHRVFGWLDKKTLPDHQLIVFAREDDYFFGILHSRAHELWALRMGTALEDRPRYTPTTCFETFPFPEPTEEQRAEISEAARRLDELRTNWLNPEDASEAELKKRTLTNLYNERPSWLAMAHERLDRAVYTAYGWTDSPGDLVEEEILKRLLALNSERSKLEGESEQKSVGS